MNLPKAEDRWGGCWKLSNHTGKSWNYRKVVARVLHAPLWRVGSCVAADETQRMGGFRVVPSIHTPCADDDSPYDLQQRKTHKQLVLFSCFYFFFYSIFSLIVSINSSSCWQWRWNDEVVIFGWVGWSLVVCQVYLTEKVRERWHISTYDDGAQGQVDQSTRCTTSSSFSRYLWYTLTTPKEVDRD